MPRSSTSILRERITFMPGGKTLVATMKAQRAYTALVSGGFRQFTSKVAASIGFHTNEANELVIENGKLTGKVAEPILGKEAKLAALKHLSLVNGLTPADAIAVGDGANDIPMLQAAGMGVALHAKPKVQEAVSAPHQPRRPDRVALSAGIQASAASSVKSSLDAAGHVTGELYFFSFSAMKRISLCLPPFATSRRTEFLPRLLGIFDAAPKHRRHRSRPSRRLR